ncbi:hypothetical protein BAY61_30265 [Prauserella marina]|uniref:SPW repeat-containing integral membrane domain-containing protein n=1 Tax=Prauserella marina TaxID=530584 RepID=A0A222VXE2_9PSEU|nr:hypothetical protein [Prauserella marina]ASR38570.1 hypothetical protein BAY61_30265 [Prauserella marina]PWV81887.1 hypothetical protein DES30_102121 [Prauserella marina]SDD14628.1 hypothetical protein SAMN05421630_106121 [Prauserella marina]
MLSRAERTPVPVNHYWNGPATEGRMTSGLPSSLMFLCAVWLGFAPFALDYGFAGFSSAVDVNDVVVALIVGAIALARMVAPDDLPWLSLVNAALGAWLVVGAFALDHTGARQPGAALANDVVIGAALLVLGVAGALLTYRQRAKARSVG